MKDKNSDPWYKEGLCFECTECGQCCTGAPGYVWVSPEEIESMATFLNLSVETFREKYVRKVDGRLSLIEDPKTFDCVFLKDKKCTLYSVRPTQCRTFPWWPQHLISEKNWEKAGKFCEGIRPNARLVSSEKIQEQLNVQLDYLSKNCD